MRQLLVISMLAGCGNSLRDDRFATGSNTIVTSARHDAFVAVNVDEGTISRIDADTDEVTELAVGSEPTRIARVGNHEYWVTLRGERAVAVVEEGDDGALSRVAVLPAGAEPHGIVASEDGRRVFVASSQSDEVTEYDGKTREVLRTFSVQDEPRWLALHPNGRVLFVASAQNATLSWIDLRTGEITPIRLPRGTRNGLDGELIELDVRNTGDIVVSADGEQLAVPTLYADTETSVDDPEVSEPVQNGYGSAGLDVSRMNPVLVTWELDAGGRPTDAGHGLFLAAFGLTRDEQHTFRSYPSSVTCTPSGREWVVTMEGSNVVLLLPTKGDREGSRNEPFGTEGSVPSSGAVDGERPLPLTTVTDGGFEQRDTAVVRTGAGPRGITFAADDDARIHTFMDRTVENLRFPELSEQLDGHRNATGRLISTHRTVTITTPSLSADIEAGRRLFFSAVDERMVAPGAGVSCATCHTDARNDGFTWTLQGEDRNTPSLAGPVHETAPVTWSDNVASVADEASLTSFLRMGGLGLTEEEAAQIEAFVTSNRYPDTRADDADAELVALGGEVFARTDVGCSGCHSGGLLTDNLDHPILDDQPIQTPTLRGIKATAPYFHDGSVRDLRDVVERSRSGTMGDTGALSDHEREALVAYLESI